MRVLVFRLSAWDVNCQQHIQQRFSAEEIAPELERLRRRTRELEATNAALRRELKQPMTLVGD